MVEVKNLKFKYQNSSNYALDDISFTINDGEWISIIGHNGSGKSTIAKLLVGLCEARGGTISYDGVILNSETKDKIRSKVGIVFQNPDNQFVGYNVKYDIAFGLENHMVERNEMIKLIDNALISTDMKDYKEREPISLSGGQKQRVAVAGILALDCDLIILDEATSMLDPKGKDDIIELIHNLNSIHKKTLITITHDLSLAYKSDRIIMLKSGKIIKDDKPENIFNERELLLSSNLDMPFSNKAYFLASQCDELKNNKELMEALWEYHLKA